MAAATHMKSKINNWCKNLFENSYVKIMRGSVCDTDHLLVTCLFVWEKGISSEYIIESWNNDSTKFFIAEVASTGYRNESSTP